MPATEAATRRRLSWAGVRVFCSAGAASIAAGVVDMVVLVALVETGTRVLVAAFIAAACGGVAHFALGKYLAFRDRSPLAFGQMLRFATVSLGTATLMALAMQLFAVELSVPYVLAKLPSSVVVFAGWTYPAQRYFVFKAAGEAV
jgi:putative flippase GtrA